MEKHLSLEYRDYMRSPLWHSVKADARRQYGKRCAGCMDSDAIHMHHLFYPRDIRDTQTKHLLPLCEHCHALVHEQRHFRPTVLNEANCGQKRRETMIYLQGRKLRAWRLMNPPKQKKKDKVLYAHTPIKYTVLRPPTSKRKVYLTPEEYKRLV